MLTEKEQCFLFNHTTDLKNVSYDIFSAYQLNGKKVFDYELFQNPMDDLKEAILRIVPKIDMLKIKEIIQSTEGLINLRKEFYYQSILIRKELILDSAYQRIQKEKNY